MELNPFVFLSVTGCDNCIAKKEGEHVCRLIKGDTADAPTEDAGLGRVKIKCPFNTTGMIILNLSRGEDSPNPFKGLH